MQLVRTEQEMAMLRSENAKLNEMLKLERNRTEIHEKNIATLEFKIGDQDRKLYDREIKIKELQTHNNQKQCRINELEKEQERLKQKYHSRYAVETQKTRGQLEREFKEKEDMLNVSVNERKAEIFLSKEKTRILLHHFYIYSMKFVRKIVKSVKFVN